MIFKAKNFCFDFENRCIPLIMGILNVTPDSFYDGNKYLSHEQAVKHALSMVENGVDIIDIGAESTRPGACCVSDEVQLERLMPVLQKLCSVVNIPISVDTTSSFIAEECLKLGVSIINDVSGLGNNPEIADIVKKYGAGLIIMHMRGKSDNMQEFAVYENILSDVLLELVEKLKIARKKGLSNEQLIIDPGIGFAKNTDQNIELLKNLKVLKKLGYPLLVGLSRKSFIGEILDKPVDERLIGSLAGVAFCLSQEVDIVRVHDVAETKEFLRMMEIFLTK